MKPRLDIRFSFWQQIHYLIGNAYEPVQGEYLLNHSRSAILLALESLDLPKGSGVGVMVYNCHTVMNAVVQAGFKPVFLDITDELMLDLDDLRRKAASISALIITHLFGIVNDVKNIRNEFSGLVIIEDCAHAYGIESLYGDFATFSVGQGKLPSIGDGGILHVLNEKYMSGVAKLYDSLSEYTTAQKTVLFVRLCITSILYRSWLYGWFTLPIKNKKKVLSCKEIIRPIKMCKGISAIFALEKDRVLMEIANRILNAKKMISVIDSIETNDYFWGHNAFMFVTICDNPVQLQKRLHQIGIDSATHFAHSIDWAKEFGYMSGDCSNAEQLIKRLLLIPIY